MFLKELEAVLIPWWLLILLLTGSKGVWHWPLLIEALYIVGTEIRYRMAVAESRAAGLRRMVRMPVASWLLRMVLRGRLSIPRGVKCFTLHVDARSGSKTAFINDLMSDMDLGSREPAIYIGNTLYDLGEFARRKLGQRHVQVIEGTLFGAWLQTWKATGHWRIIKIDTSLKNEHVNSHEPPHR